ncbi:hypothetical protein WR25_12572 [Diploscapter pachys]|uniref:Uncharacterized protein n=1 Tax=Diploscapter pachys TaxID=2018661 RepID=A0A2A2L7I0_9BILA|nr:hypothetical protein WR25_12572 [Diploscapter pachys]
MTVEIHIIDFDDHTGRKSNLSRQTSICWIVQRERGISVASLLSISPSILSKIEPILALSLANSRGYPSSPPFTPFLLYLSSLFISAFLYIVSNLFSSFVYLEAETVSEIVASGVPPSNVIVVRGDLREESVQREIIQKTIDTFGKIDILINNAGGIGPDMCGRSDFNQNMDDFDYLFNLNLRAAVTLTKLALPYLVESKGEIINTSSIAGLPTAATNLLYYSMTKAALDQYTRTLAVKMIREGVRVNSVNPGIVNTKIFNKHGRASEDIVKALSEDPLAVPAGYYGLPEDIANAVAFLADRKVSRYIVGHTLVIDGGTSLVTKLLNCDILELGREMADK